MDGLLHLITQFFLIFHCSLVTILKTDQLQMSRGQSSHVHIRLFVQSRMKFAQLLQGNVVFGKIRTTNDQLFIETLQTALIMSKWTTAPLSSFRPGDNRVLDVVFFHQDLHFDLMKLRLTGFETIFRCRQLERPLQVSMLFCSEMLFYSIGSTRFY